MEDGIKPWNVLLFDAMGTLIRFSPSYPELVAAVCRDQGFPINAYQIAHLQRQGGFRLLDGLGEVGMPAYPTFTTEESRQLWGRLHTRMLARLGLRESKLVEVLHCMVLCEHSYGVYEDVKPVLLDLRKHGFTLGLISNFEATLPQVLKHAGISDFFDVLVVSALDGVAKPNREAFLLATLRAGAIPSRCLYVGDNPTQDVAGALGAGLSAVLLDRSDRYSDIDCPHIRSLVELKSFVTSRTAGA